MCPPQKSVLGALLPTGIFGRREEFRLYIIEIPPGEYANRSVWWTHPHIPVSDPMLVRINHETPFPLTSYVDAASFTRASGSRHPSAIICWTNFGATPPVASYWVVPHWCARQIADCAKELSVERVRWRHRRLT